MEHHFRDGAGEKNLDGGETLWAVGQRINEARDGAIDFGPICDTRAAELGGVRDRGDVKQKIRRSAECCVDNHGVSNRSIGENVGGCDAEMRHA